MRRFPAVLALSLVTALSVSACNEQGDSAPDRALEGMKDAFNMRENEEIKDAMEDLQSAAESAAEAARKEAEAMKKKMENDDQ